MGYARYMLPLLMLSAAAAAQDPWEAARENAERSRTAIRFCDRYAAGWLSQADPRSGLIPRNLGGDSFWNAPDAAADNYPFIVLTAYVTDDYHLKRAALHILEQEQRLTNRVDSLPDDFLFASQSFRSGAPDMDRIIFGASEYAKDGLMPITEWIGPGPWLDRMEGLVRDIWKHAACETECGAIPSRSVEVNGELLQTTSRLFWLTGDAQFKEWCFRLADHYLLHEKIAEWKSLGLRDHGCEIIGGLSEAYLIASREDAARWDAYRPVMHAILDRVLECGASEDGLLYNAVNPRECAVVIRGFADTWGYNYNAFLTVAEIDGEERYREAVKRVLENIHRYLDYNWEGNSADGIADSAEGGLNLLNRIPVDSAFEWVDGSMDLLFAKQRADGIVEGWHGDGNSARTALMYALWKTQGIAPAPWTGGLAIGAVRSGDGGVRVVLKSDWSWTGRLRFDRPRHRVWFHMPLDYPRINQFPEWFTAEDDVEYEVTVADGTPETVRGRDLWDYTLSLKQGVETRLTVRRREEPPMLRTQEYTPRSATEARAWQKELRAKLSTILKLDTLMFPGREKQQSSRAQSAAVDGARQSRPAHPDPLPATSRLRPEGEGAGRRGNSASTMTAPHGIALLPEIVSSDKREGYTLSEVEINSTPGRRIRVILAAPEQRPGSFPAVVCIHGHSGNRMSPYDPDSIYKGFGDELAKRGYVTISTDVGQHKVYEDGMSLMGERLWDLIRCVDYLESRPEVDRNRIGCAGLSLGGEMAMWLGAMDERVDAVVSAGFLTRMDQMERNHCMCWKFPGLRELVDYADIYSLIAPRSLQCQNGEQEPANQFPPSIAKEALEEVRLIYSDFDVGNNVALDVHKGAHEIDLPALLRFFDANLK